MDPNRQHWNQQQQVLLRALERPGADQPPIPLFLAQHAQVHAGQMSGAGLWSFEDELWDGLSDAGARRIPPRCEHSIAWMAWHTARCEDITLNLLAADRPQVLLEEGWIEQMQVAARDTGNAMTPAEIEAFSAAIDLAALRAYRVAVGRRTRQIVQALAPADFKRPVDPALGQRLLDEGAVLPAASGLIDYWCSRTIAGLLLMPATRHHVVHWNEAAALKKKK